MTTPLRRLLNDLADTWGTRSDLVALAKALGLDASGDKQSLAQSISNKLNRDIDQLEPHLGEIAHCSWQKLCRNHDRNPGRSRKDTYRVLAEAFGANWGVISSPENHPPAGAKSGSNLLRQMQLPTGNNIESRDYQIEAQRAVLTAISENDPCLLHVATGGGKTLIANNVVDQFLSNDKNAQVHVLWIAKD